ncbi:MAG: four helix bundle protein [Chitinophagaceae bacterium]|nr:four helix bundle protein [Chitinophagaceae bacterium]
MGDYRKLIGYQKAYDLALEIFQLTKKFPAEEKYSLTDQLRRSSRSVCCNFVEAYKRKRYRDYFVSKLNDAETENAETQVWIDFSLSFGYITAEIHQRLTEKNNAIAKLILYMINHPEKFT